MNTQEVLDPRSWAERTFGGVHLHDLRRTKRAVQARGDPVARVDAVGCSCRGSDGVWGFFDVFPESDRARDRRYELWRNVPDLCDDGDGQRVFGDQFIQFVDSAIDSHDDVPR